MSRYVRYEEFGGPENLSVVQVDPPTAGPGQVRVRVRAAGLNPVDCKIFRGPAAAAYGAHLPSGVGNDFSGLIDETGPGVTALQVGDAMFGGARNHAIADFVVLDADVLVRKPEGLPFEVAGSLAVAGRTAMASVRSLALTAEDTVLVSAAAGGVGVLAAQLAVRAGSTVIGTAGPANHEFLRTLGVLPVAYGDGLVERLRAAVPRGITAVLDNHGQDTVDAALALGVPADRINTIAARDAQPGVTHVGGAQARTGDLAEIANLLADGSLVLPIDSVYPLERVVEAYQKLEAGHLRGKIVLITE